MRTQTHSLKAKGISPLIATLILIAITIVGGILVYHVFFSTAASISSSSGVQVVSGELYTNPNILTLTVKNSGSQPIIAINGTINGPGITSNNKISVLAQSTGETSPLSPGHSIAYTNSSMSGLNLVDGDQYTIVLTAYGSNGASFTTSYTVTAQA